MRITPSSFAAASLRAPLLILTFVSGCSGGTTVVTPHPQRSGPPAATTTATPGSTNGMPSAAQIVAALNDAQTYYASLPTTTAATELAATAKHMISSGNFTAAVVSPGGITGTLPGGLQAVLFADRPEEQDQPPSSSGSAKRAIATRVPADLSGTSTSHEIAYLVNSTDKYSGAFHPQRQIDLANAWQTVFSAVDDNTYEADALPVSLAVIVALGTNHPVDFLSLATHGYVALLGTNSTPQYINLSDTPITTTTIGRYLGALASIPPTIYPAAVLMRPDGGAEPAEPLPEFAFTPQFVAQNVKFNPGAYFDNQSCFGQNTMIADDVLATYAAVGVARYSGWTFEADGNASDQNEAFMADRLIGETSPALAAYVAQRDPLQRPFDLADVLSAMGTETRTGGLVTNSNPYTYSPAVDGWPAATFLTTGTAAITDAIAIPSVATMTVTEGTPASTLTIEGEFPAGQGDVVLEPQTGTSIPLTIDSWTPTSIVVDLPAASSSNLGGEIEVEGPTGLDSPPVPLTYWSGTFTYNESAKISDFGEQSGSGTGSLGIAMNLGIRADVAPVVPTIDVSPVPQNLYVSNVTPNSTGTLSDYMGSFSSSSAGGQARPSRRGRMQSGGTETATITSSGSVSLAPYGASNFIQISSGLDPVDAGASCNNALPGPQNDGQGNVACPGFAYEATNAATCSDNQDGALCAQATQYGAQIGSPSSQYGDDQDYDNMPSTLTFTMDPNSYAISVASTPGTTYTENYSNFSPTTETLTGSFAAPVSPPDSSATATAKRRQGTALRGRPNVTR